jgi:XTP/dITP diphosphohydrolase
MSSVPRPLLLATSNPAKAAKLRWLFEGLPFTLEDLRAYPNIALPDETGGSFSDNARLKAQAASAAFGGLALASDGGVQIPALGDRWEPLRTGRAAGPNASDADKAHHLLALMQGLTGVARTVRWAEAVALADHGETIALWEASDTHGVLTDAYDPTNARPGFWVYSLWMFPHLGKRYVDLTPQELESVDGTWMALREQASTWVNRLNR